MTRFLVRRALFALLLIVASSSAALLLTRLAPGDLTIDLGAGKTAEEVAAARARFNLDQPMLQQWIGWAGRAARFDFGDSFLYGAPVGPLVLRRAGNSALLGLVTLVVATAVGISLGIFTGSRRRGFAVALIRTVSIACVSMPPLLTSLLLVFIAARTDWFPLGGMTSSSASASTWGAWMLDVAAHLPLPVLALALPMAATFERLQADAIGETLRQPFVAAAAARGVSREAMVLRHAWPVSLRAISAVYGLMIGALLSGSFVVEFVTAWPGLGRLMYDALRARDIYLVAGCAAFGAGLLALGTFLGDLLLVSIDPRAHEGTEA
jgi:peptide/nickel transport system permease protein